MQKVTDNVYANTTFQGCNSGFIVTKEGAIVIDTPMVPVEAQNWKQEIEKYAPIKYVIINEAHVDHYCGSCYLGGTLIGTSETVVALKTARIENFIQDFSRIAPDSPAPDKSFYFRPPDISLEGEAVIYSGDHTINILRVPGHGEVTDKSAFCMMQDMILVWIDFIESSIKEGIDLESLKKKAKEANEFASIPKEGPMADFFYMNIESLYRLLLRE